MTGPIQVMDFTPAQTSSLKKAIEKKLYELDSLADETLADYVIVLLANRHGKDKIMNEMEDFLSPMVVETFAEWLFTTMKEIKHNADEYHAKPKSRVFAVALRGLQNDQRGGTAEDKESCVRRSRAQRFNIPERSRSPDRQDTMGRQNRRHLRSLDRRNTSPSPRRIIKYRSISSRREREDNDWFYSKRPLGNKVKDARELISPSQRNIHRMDDIQSPKAPESDDVPEKKTRCTYWPNCKAGNSCIFVHPSEPCKHFPNCVFGDNCLYIHPAISCKFQDKCQNPTCNYLHSSPAQLHGKGVFSIANNPFHPPSGIACRFYPNCKNTQCPFMHPSSMACKFGENCQRPACPFTHPDKRTLASKAIVNAPCRYGKNCAKPDCPFRHVNSPIVDTLSLTHMESSMPTVPEAAVI